MNDRWPVPQRIREQAMETISSVLDDPEAELSKKLSCIKTVLEADKLNLKQEELKIRKQPKLHIHADMSRDQLLERLKELTGITNFADPVAAIQGYLANKANSSARTIESKIIND